MDNEKALRADKKIESLSSALKSSERTVVLKGLHLLSRLILDEDIELAATVALAAQSFFKEKGFCICNKCLLSDGDRHECN